MNIFGYPIYEVKMKNHELYKEQFMPFVNNDDYFTKMPYWASSSDTTMGHEKNNELPWNDITKEAIDHVFDYISNFELTQQVQCYADPWLNRYYKGDYQEQHNHSNLHVHFSCAYMLSSPDTESHFVFVDRTQDYYNQIGLGRFCNKIPEKLYTPNQDEGTLLIFPSHLDHYVKPNRSDDVRATISMNFYLT